MKRNQFSQSIDKIWYADWVSIRNTIIVISSLVIGLFILTNLGYIGMLWSTRHMSGIAEGRIVNRKDQMGIIVSKQGNRTDALSTKYEFEYNVNGNLYSSTCYLTSSIWNMKKLALIRTSPLPMKIAVRYDKKNPYNSTIWLP